jgi:hypothetical protein
MDESYMKDSQGRLVPIMQVKPIDLARDQIVREIVGKSLDLANIVAGFKNQAIEDVKAFIDLSLEQYGVKVGGQKGNVTLMSYDGEYRVLIAINDRITFDERLQAAKSLIDECIKEWTQGARGELRVLIDNAFAVDKAGKINTGRVLGLRRLEIVDEKWNRAMQAIADSIVITESKEYIRIYRRNKEGEYDLISLGLAS